jgi:glutathione synthase/RimK-type ligase-like ATP-grasp enzyme
MATSSRKPHVLIISTKLDIATDVVVKLLNDRGVRVSRFNTEDFPFKASLTTKFLAHENGASVTCAPPGISPTRLDDISSMWYRRVRSPEKPTEMLPGIYDFCLRESRSTLLGSLLTQSIPIMSAPASIWAAEHKIYQLAIAQRTGLHIPETLVTNDPNEVCNAFKRFKGRMIAKPVRTGFVDLGEEQRAIFTSQVLESHLEDLKNAHLSPVIYQPLVDKSYDVRVTIVGSRIFTAEIDSQSDPEGRVDWRHASTPFLPHYRAQLPSSVSEKLQSLLANLGLAFGAIDLIRTQDDEYVFLEINPNGQWLWLDDMLELGISDAVADWLSGRMNEP